MTSLSPAPLPPRIPENAPFSAEQRAWLNGFIAGLLSLDGREGQVAGAPAAAAKDDPLDDGDDGAAPWHDQTLPLAKRMALAEGRPLRRRMMAAMGQQDCGQCGYSCEDYADAIFLRAETELNLCVPGGKATIRMLKALHAELEGEGAPAQAVAPATPSGGPTRDRPVMASVVGVTRLNAEGSAKETNHVELAVEPAGLPYAVGDSLGVFATNDPALADAIVLRLGAEPEAEVGDGNGRSRRLRDALLEDVSLAPAPDELFELLAGLAGGETERRRLLAMAQGDDPDGDLETLDVLAALEKFPGLQPAPRDLIGALGALQPRLYSISSSPKVEPGRVSITVDALRYLAGGRPRKGLASCFLAERVKAGDRIPVYIQKARDFALPSDETPIVMVGPGTGIAPFRAFLQERLARKASGGAWLFFGHRHEATDFLYREELEGFQAAGTLTRLTTAWSRDGAEKVYVQHRLRAEGRELFRWLEEGAHFYVCGDAARMAGDVERALREVVAEHGGLDAAGARAYLDGLAKAGRYQKDVY